MGGFFLGCVCVTLTGGCDGRGDGARGAGAEGRGDGARGTGACAGAVGSGGGDGSRGRAGAGAGGAASARGVAGCRRPQTQHSLASGLFRVVQKHCQSAIFDAAPCPALCALFSLI